MFQPDAEAHLYLSLNFFCSSQDIFTQVVPLFKFGAPIKEPYSGYACVYRKQQMASGPSLENLGYTQY